jgi:hypothetical protein
MRQAPAIIRLNEDEVKTLADWSRCGKKEHRRAEWARIILLTLEAQTNQQIADHLQTGRGSGVEVATGEMLVGATPHGPARRLSYDASTAKRVLALLDEPPPKAIPHGLAVAWRSGLGDVSKDQVRRILRHNICLERRRSWCISTAPQFGPKAADVSISRPRTPPGSIQWSAGSAF